MILAFDECTSPLHDEAYTARSAERTHRWAERSLRAFRESEPQHGYEQALYGIVQGGAFEAVRKGSAGVIAGMDFDGVAIGATREFALLLGPRMSYWASTSAASAVRSHQTSEQFCWNGVTGTVR